jgi:hypothetical protein
MPLRFVSCAKGRADPLVRAGRSPVEKSGVCHRDEADQGVGLRTRAAAPPIHADARKPSCFLGILLASRLYLQFGGIRSIEHGAQFGPFGFQPAAF